MGGVSLVDNIKLLENIPLVVILGPTASGKTEVSIELSYLLDIEVISADSRQVYKYLNIGTATPTENELKAVEHHFISTLNPDEYFSAGMFGELAAETAVDIFERKRIPVVVGGSGLYIRALCEGLFDEDDGMNNDGIRIKLNQKLKQEGIDELFTELKNIDPESAAKYSDKNPRRIIRALEYYYTAGRKLSDAHQESHEKRPFNVLYYGVARPREVLYDRINKRTEMIWNGGLKQEAEHILELGYSQNLNALNTVGYKEYFEFAGGRISEAEAIELMKRNTRRYAKRQMTWFGRNDKVKWLEGGAKDIAEAIRCDIGNIRPEHFGIF